MFRETRAGGPAAQCFALQFSFFSLNAHPLLPLSVMISRTLGPEVGGSIGLMFYLANVCGCAVSLLGLVEAILDVFGAGLCSLPGWGSSEDLQGLGFWGSWQGEKPTPGETHSGP